MKKILVIDDDEGIKDALKAILESEGFQVDLASNEKTLLSSDNPPGLIFVDYFLSGTNGHSIAQSIRSHQPTKDIPIVMLSADPNNRQKIQKEIVDDFLDKPFEMNDLLTITNKYLTA